ncbi:MAG: hypothetical protein PHT69_00970 [Bacteroidales bacterium]|nr:hypothetical protein [Bacteroidales bacterium]
MYILKIKGNGKIPDYVQVRDDSFTLLAYFKVNILEKATEQAPLKPYKEIICSLIKKMPYGKIEYTKL